MFNNHEDGQVKSKYHSGLESVSGIARGPGKREGHGAMSNPRCAKVARHAASCFSMLIDMSIVSSFTDKICRVGMVIVCKSRTMCKRFTSAAEVHGLPTCSNT